MAKKIIAVLTLFTFSLFSASCMRAYKVQQESMDTAAKKGAKAKLLGVQTKSREYLEFREGSPAKIQADAVCGEILKTVEFNRADIAEKIDPVQGKLGEVLTRDGKQFRFLTARADGDKLICQIYNPVSIPLSEIQLAWLKQVNTGATILQTAVAYVLILTVVIPLLVLLNESGEEIVDTLAGLGEDEAPPPVYKDFWESYFIDAELHGAAPGQGFSITEWSAVDCSAEPSGRSKILFGNELEELKSTDELKVMAVDHPAGVKVLPDVRGTMHTLSNPVAPRKAYDQRGRDILPLVSHNDKLFWASPEEERNPKKKEDLRGELIFEIPKPKGAKKAKLLVNATNTMWASDFAGLFLGIPGRNVLEPSFDSNAPDLAGGRARDWYRQEEFYKLRVWVETKNGWQPRQAIYGGGPFVPRDQVCMFDIGDVKGPTLRVKLMPPANFWMIDRLAVDFGKDLRLHVTEVALETAAAPGLESDAVIAALAQADGSYLDLPNQTDKVEITFLAPPPGPGLNRSVILRTVSRYEIRPGVGGTGR